MQLLKLRYLQLKRDLGYWVILIAAAAFYFTKEISADRALYGICIAGIFLFLLLNYHLNRKDLNFITKYFRTPKQTICLNYNLLTLPFSAAFIFNGFYEIALALHLASSLIVFSKINTSGPALLFIGRRIPDSHFEWISGIRRNFYPIVVLLIVALILSPVKFFAVLALFLLNSIFLGFYSSFEPLLMMNPEGLSATEFLKRKVTFFNKLFLTVNALPLLVNSIIHPDITWFNACFLIGFLIIGPSFIYIKYAHYKPNNELHFQVDSILLYASTIIPFLLPISFFLSKSHQKKAILNLSLYIDDNR